MRNDSDITGFIKISTTLLKLPGRDLKHLIAFIANSMAKGNIIFEGIEVETKDWIIADTKDIKVEVGNHYVWDTKGDYSIYLVKQSIDGKIWLVKNKINNPIIFKDLKEVIKPFAKVIKIFKNA